MLYMLASVVLMLTLIKSMWEGIIPALAGDRQNLHKNKFIVFPTFLLIAVVVSPFYLSMGFLESNFTVSQVSVISLTSQWLGFASSLVLAIIYFMASDKGTKFWYTGCTITALILAFIFFDSAKFNTGSTGAGNSSFIKSIASDVECDRALVVFKYLKGEQSVWHCPKSIALMQESGKMFIPWPDYESGSSSKLTVGIEELQKRLDKQAEEDKSK